MTVDQARKTAENFAYGLIALYVVAVAVITYAVS